MAPSARDTLGVAPSARGTLARAGPTAASTPLLKVENSQPPLPGDSAILLTSTCRPFHLSGVSRVGLEVAVIHVEQGARRPGHGQRQTLLKLPVASWESVRLKYLLTVQSLALWTQIDMGKIIINLQDL